LQENTNRQATLAKDIAALDPDTPIYGVKLLLTQTETQRAALNQLIEQQRNPGSAEYQNWLSPEQYGERFGLSQNDLAKIVSWLRSGGFTIGPAARGRNWIGFSGTAGQIAHMFRTELHRVVLNGEAHFANLTDPSIPASLNGIVSHVNGLDDFRPQSQAVVRAAFDNANGSHFLSPADFATIYDVAALYNAGFDGSGQKLAVAGQADVNLADIRSFRQYFNLPARDPVTVLVGTDPGTSLNDQLEADLDIEWAGAMARNATIVYVYSTNVFNSVQYAIDQALAPVISSSYCGCELLNPGAFYQTLAQQANVEGITWVNSSGDTGAAGCDAGQVAVNGPSAPFPANIPEVTGVGGSEFNEAGAAYWSAQNGPNSQSALSYIPEKAWNDTSLDGRPMAGGGAASLLFPKPWWQFGPGVPADAARDVPEVSLAASADHDGYLIYNDGQMVVVGGTSAGAPAFAGILSVMNQYLQAKGTISKPGLGNINPQLYNLARHTTELFHDITTGDNSVPCEADSPGCVNGFLGYAAGPAYDLATGLGSIDAYNLVTQWASVPAAVNTTMMLMTSSSSITATSNVDVTALVTGANTPVGNVTYRSAGVSLGSVVLSGSGCSATAMLPLAGSLLPLGSDTISASYFEPGNPTPIMAWASVYVTRTGTVTSLTASSNQISREELTTLTATVIACTGTVVPIGTISFAVLTTILGTANLVSSDTGTSATLTIRGTCLALGPNTVTASFGTTPLFGNSSGSSSVTVLQRSSHTDRDDTVSGECH
jgi:subtilase family serine protease